MSLTNKNCIIGEEYNQPFLTEDLIFSFQPIVFEIMVKRVPSNTVDPSTD